MGGLKPRRKGTVSIVNGRPVASGGTVYVVKCYIKRMQYTGVTSGSKPLPLESQLEGRMLPGASGDQFYYRGFALQKAPLGGGNWLGDLSGLTFTDITAQESFLLPGTVRLNLSLAMTLTCLRLYSDQAVFLVVMVLMRFFTQRLVE